jgi:hypothetical protein
VVSLESKVEEMLSPEVMGEETSSEATDEKTSPKLVVEESSTELIDEDMAVGLGLGLKAESNVVEEITPPTGEAASQRPNSG